MIARLLASLRRTGGRPVPDPEPERLAEQVAAARLGLDYDEDDRRRDFRRVFLDDPAGRRVLAQLLDWCHLWRAIPPNGSDAVHMRLGERNIGLKIITACAATPLQLVRGPGRRAAAPDREGEAP